MSREPTDSPGQRSKAPVFTKHRALPGQVSHVEACAVQSDTVRGIASVQTGGTSLRCCTETSISQVSPPDQSAPMKTKSVEITASEYAAALKLCREYVRAKHRLAWTQWEFDLRDETHEREHYWNERDLRRSGGAEGLPQEKFDLRWVEHNSKLTREFIDAEEVFKTTRTAAVNGGRAILDLDASSVFEHDRSEGYSPSQEETWLADATKGMIEGWRKPIAAIS